MALRRVDPICLVLIAIGVVIAFSAPPPVQAGSRVAVGVYLPEAEREPGALDGYAREAGQNAALVHVYRDWSSPPFESAPLERITSRGALPLVTWEPWEDWSRPVSLTAIASGAYDGYIEAAAARAAAWGRPLFVRFAHEMNGDWYPWAGGANGNGPAVYRSAWRHIVRVFRRAGASNVRWVWTPFVDGGRLPFERYYPGDRWTDWVGLDGYNWGNPFVSFARIFGRSYGKLARLTEKPQIIAETGSVGSADSKAAWIRRALGRALPQMKRVHALLWWSAVHPDSASDWRIDSSSAAARALRQSLRARRYAPGNRFLLRFPSVLGGGG